MSWWIISYTKYISLNNELCRARLTLIDMNPDELSQGLRYHPFIVGLDVVEVVILLLIHHVECVFQKKQKM